MNKKLLILLNLWIVVCLAACGGGSSGDDVNTEDPVPSPTPDTPVSSKKRIVITTDLGPTGDPDDYQSLTHVFLYGNEFDIEAIVTSPPHGNTGAIRQLIDVYAKDYPKLVAKDPSYPTPEYYKSIVHQGARQSISEESKFSSTPGSMAIVDLAMKDDPRPLHVLNWGGNSNLAQVFKDAAFVAPKLRAYSIGENNTERTNFPYRFIRNNPESKNMIWIIAGETFRGMYVTKAGDTSKYGNLGFVRFIRDFGNLGENFYEVSEGIGGPFGEPYGIKMGDTPSFLFMINGDFNNPQGNSWGGSFCKEEGSTNRWVDCQDPALEAKGFSGAVTVSRHRTPILMDFEKRLELIK